MFITETKKLRFADSLPELIMIGQKTATWRINDEKDIRTGDFLSLCRNDGSEFVNARVLSAKEVAFKDMTAQDKEGHEKYVSDREMFEKFSQYYNISVGTDTLVKIIKFRIVL